MSELEATTQVLMDRLAIDDLLTRAETFGVIGIMSPSTWWADNVIEHFAPDKRNEVAALAARLGLRLDLGCLRIAAELDLGQRILGQRARLVRVD